VKKKLRPRKPYQVVMLTLPWEQLPDYPDIGSYKMNADNSPAFIGAADTGNDVSNAAILLHEFVESFWCWQHGVKEALITMFDQKWFSEERNGVKHIQDSPGDDPEAPYYEGHLIATRFEREFIVQNGMTWEQHERNCQRIYT